MIFIVALLCVTLQVQRHQRGVGSRPGPHQDGQPGEERYVSPDCLCRKCLIWQTSFLFGLLSCSRSAKAPWGSASERKSKPLWAEATGFFVSLCFSTLCDALHGFIVEFIFLFGPWVFGVWGKRMWRHWRDTMEEQEDNSWIVVVKSPAMRNIHCCWLFFFFPSLQENSDLTAC